MSKATKRISLRPETKQRLDERKDDGKTYDLWVREQLGDE